MSRLALPSCVLTGFVAGLCALAAAGAAAEGVRKVPVEESILVEALEEAVEGNSESALGRLESLLRQAPRFHLARLVYADLLAAKAGRVEYAKGGLFGTGSRAESFRQEMAKRVARHRDAAPANQVPAAILQLAGNQSRAILVDQDAARLYLFENVDGRPQRVADYYVSTGKNGASKRREGDQRTPVGVYFITGRIGSGKLPDFYGPGAFPVNYPNEWDRRQGRTGYGIWIHGVPSDTYSRPPRASDGCLALPNPDVAQLWSMLGDSATPVVIADRAQWVEPGAATALAGDAVARIERWREDWESLDFARYSKHYSRGFRSDSADYSAWMAHKRRVNGAKRYIRVALSDVSVFGYPGEENLLVATFDQDYRSDTFVNRVRKRQYWRRESDGDWRIVYEGTVRLRPEHLKGIPFSARSELARLSLN